MFDPCRQCARLRVIAPGLRFGWIHANNRQVLFTSVQSRNVRTDRRVVAKNPELTADDVEEHARIVMLAAVRALGVTRASNPLAIPTAEASQEYRAVRFPNVARTTASTPDPSGHEAAGS